MKPDFENIENEKGYSEANDRPTNMTEMDICMKKLEGEGFTDQFRVEKKFMKSTQDDSKKYKPKEVKVVDFYRFEGLSDPDDMSILYAIETKDGRKGTLVDAYGNYSDDDTEAFLKDVETHKRAAEEKDE